MKITTPFPLKLPGNNEESSIIPIHNTRIAATMLSIHDRDAFIINDRSLFRQLKAIGRLTSHIATTYFQINK